MGTLAKYKYFGSWNMDLFANCRPCGLQYIPHVWFANNYSSNSCSILSAVHTTMPDTRVPLKHSIASSSSLPYDRPLTAAHESYQRPARRARIWCEQVCPTPDQHVFQPCSSFVSSLSLPRLFSFLRVFWPMLYFFFMHVHFNANPARVCVPFIHPCTNSGVVMPLQARHIFLFCRPPAS